MGNILEKLDNDSINNDLQQLNCNRPTNGKCLICHKKCDSYFCFCKKCNQIIDKIQQNPNQVSTNTQLILDRMVICELVRNVANIKCQVCKVMGPDILHNGYCMTCGVNYRLAMIADNVTDPNIKLVYNPNVNNVKKMKFILI